MARKATNQVTTIGIDIGKNSFHLIDPNVRFGSQADVKRHPSRCLLSGVKRTEITDQPKVR